MKKTLVTCLLAALLVTSGTMQARTAARPSYYGVPQEVAELALANELLSSPSAVRTLSADPVMDDESAVAEDTLWRKTKRFFGDNKKGIGALTLATLLTLLAGDTYYANDDSSKWRPGRHIRGGWDKARSWWNSSSEKTSS